MSMQMDAEFQKEQNGTLLSGWEHWVVGIGGGGGQGPLNQKIGLTSITFFFGASCSKTKFHYFWFPDTFWVKTIPIAAKKRGGENSPPKDLMHMPVCWANMVHFWKPWKHAFWPPPGCR